MAHRKAGGSTKNVRDSKPKYLGVKLSGGQKAQSGSIIIRQRGTKYLAGENVRIGKDHTLFSTIDGEVTFSKRRKKNFDGRTKVMSVVNVFPVKPVKTRVTGK